MKVYYAHCKAIYNTPQEERDLKLLESLGYEILNPNEKEHQVNCRNYTNPMEYFGNLVSSCEALAFRGLPNGRIPSGVIYEIEMANSKEMPIFELPVHIGLRAMGLEETRAYLTEVGNR